jgi:hypothetical protein
MAGLRCCAMHRLLPLIFAIGVIDVSTAAAQSLFILQGERAVEGSVGWSVGPFSNGVETQVGGSLDGRWDIAFGFNHYRADFGGDDDSTFTEWSPSVRYFMAKEVDDGTPLTFAAHAAFFRSSYDGEADGWYSLIGGQLFKRFDFTNAFAMYPYVGFALAAESYALGGADSERSVYLTRQFGVHTVIALGADTWVRVVVEEHGSRRETYRGARAALVRRF